MIRKANNTMASPLAANTTATASAAAVVTPGIYKALLEENKKLKVTVGRIKDSHKITAIAAMNQGRAVR